MSESRELPPIALKAHFASAPKIVFDLLTTDRGRERFWAEQSESEPNAFILSFAGGERIRCDVVVRSAPHRFAFRYFDGSLVEISLAGDGHGGTDLSLTETGFKGEAHRTENHAGWIQVLLCLKAAADHGVNLRNHDAARTWSRGYCDG